MTSKGDPIILGEIELINRSNTLEECIADGLPSGNKVHGVTSRPTRDKELAQTILCEIIARHVITETTVDRCNPGRLGRGSECDRTPSIDAQGCKAPDVGKVRIGQSVGVAENQCVVSRSDQSVID